MDNKNFEKALIFNNKKLFDIIPKGDTHSHASLSSNRKIFKEYFNDKTLDKFIPQDNINSISKFIKNNLLDITLIKNKHIKLIECSILTAIEDNISPFITSIDYRICVDQFKNNISGFLTSLIKLKDKYSKIIDIQFDIGISKEKYINDHYNTIVKLIDSNLFSGIDLYGLEKPKLLKKFKKLYKYASMKNLKLKAHIGEFGDAKEIKQAIKLLSLDEIHHGINIVSSKYVMKYAKRKNIRFNVCPSSNLLLKRVNNISVHPIKKMFNSGLIVSIGTDDQLLFEKSLFDEYKLLYDNNVFSIDELNQIRHNSISF